MILRKPFFAKGIFRVGLLAGTTALLALTSLSGCRVNFSDPQPGSDSSGGGGTVTTLGALTCTVFLNGTQTTATVATSAQNPTVSGTCTVTNATLSWTVTNAAGTAVTINGLTGASSVGDFFSAGNGVYSVVLNATAPNCANFTSTPLTVTVQIPQPITQPSITCTMALNGGTVPVTVNVGGSNPTVTATCQPSNASYTWTVVNKATNTVVVVSGLAGSSSTPLFSSLSPGTYQISLASSEAGYNSYQSTTPLVVTVAPAPVVIQNFNTTVTAQNNQVDVLLVVDDSNSMLQNNQKLAVELQGLVDNLTNQGLDWQMCVTVTRALPVSSSNPNLYWGASVFWQGNTASPGYILKSGTPNLDQIFLNTINQIGAGWAGSEDERPLKSAWWSLYNGDYHYSDASGCYRANAGLALVFISNEDERSIGGDKTQQYYSNEYYPLDNDDTPGELITQVQSIFGVNKRFIANAIVVRPNDISCMATQDAMGTKSHFGVVNSQIVGLTNGYIGSICDANFAQSINFFQSQIVKTMQSVTLSCTPLGISSVTLTPKMNFTYSVSGTSVTFSPALPVGTNVQIQYTCSQ